jgi:hypothetical protein
MSRQSILRVAGLNPGLQILQFFLELVLPPGKIPRVKNKNKPDEAVREEKIDIQHSTTLDFDLGNSYRTLRALRNE